ncbi:hypothetical protein MRB53_018050 [Persea americana]|uniref:Uncharacterized protein n=1 Tax=Persea americana TaxID=3435 RepID=A0ACC2M6U5_PERAE|nr:hypothetical protein MRB53_018050 [Persea americana]|eukprot:TRINITY_DN51425_c0_g1_i1.p1 TRINITY_DN51425_c0_g1~~TRINITY_DN51425_c0_g1_i1.p1  ORF type:complete len:133 (+),score=27.65 TRINITY_DN51425_c0_g1_i1:79-477(+)
MDEYGNPIGTVPGHRGMTATGRSSGAYGAVPGTVIGGGMNPTGHSTGSGHHGLSAILHRSGSSSSSSSSEEDYLGGRRKKKGLKERIKEKLPGSHKSNHTPLSGGVHEHHEHEKKGIMEKIKEKLPGHHHSH